MCIFIFFKIINKLLKLKIIYFWINNIVINDIHKKKLKIF